MFEAGGTVLVACSGGPDSVCLLYSLAHLHRLFRIRLAVFHLDHRLREGSDADAVYVRRLADRLALPSHLRAVSDVPARGTSVEAWARDRRRAAAAEVARAVGASTIATAHTQDDQAETLLAWALMGDGLRAIRPKTGPYARPLLDVSREEVEGVCRALRLRPRRGPAPGSRSPGPPAVRSKTTRSSRGRCSSGGTRWCRGRGTRSASGSPPSARFLRRSRAGWWSA